MATPITYPLDLSGVAATNLITNELHTVAESRFKDYYFIVPNFAPFYVNRFSISISINNVVTPLVEDVDFSFALQDVTGSRTTGKIMYGAVTLHNLSLNGVLLINYQTIGGNIVANRLGILSSLADKAYNPKTTIWDILTGVPQTYPPSQHYQGYSDFQGQAELVAKLGEIRDAILQNSSLTKDEIANFLNIINTNYTPQSTTFSYNVGDIIRKTDTVTPSGFLRCNGASVSKTTYAGLYAVIGDTFTVITDPGNGKPWKQQYQINSTQSADITGWTIDPNSLPGILGGSQAIVTKNRVYLLGGNPGGATTLVYTAPINLDGTLGVWVGGTSLPSLVAWSQAIVTKNRVYLLGGYDWDANSLVYTAPINLDGTLGAWTAGPSLPAEHAASQAIVTKNRVYLLGGYGQLTSLSSVHTAPINLDGTLGAWTAGPSLPAANAGSQAIVTKNRVYLLGGSSQGVTSLVYTAPINSDGTLGVWGGGTSLPGALSFSQAIVTKNRVYLFGGSADGFLSTSAVYTAPVNLDGTLGTWTEGTSLPYSVGSHQAIVTKNRVYLLGGNNGTALYSSVCTAPISGGLNDYSPYYDGSYVPPVLSTFMLPDLSPNDALGVYSYIKF